MMMWQRGTGVAPLRRVVEEAFLEEVSSQLRLGWQKK